MNKDQIAIIFIGRSGCGKGTQSKLVKNFLEDKKQSVLSFGTGNYFRDMMTQTDHTAQLVKKIYDEGGRHPDFLAITILGNVFRFEYKEGQSVLIDGVARSLHEAGILLEILNFYEFKNIKVVYLNVSHEWCVDKLLKRGRSDDNAEVFKIKHEWFENDVKPAIEYFKNNKDVDFIEVNGERPIEEISKEIISKI